VDINRLGQSGETMLGHDIDSYKNRFESFGWKGIHIDGHDIADIVKAFKELKK
jgi:transketolase